MAFGVGVKFANYEVVIRVNRDGTFIQNYQASDHQLVKATLSFAQ